MDLRARLARSRLSLAVETRSPGRWLDAALRGGVDLVRLRAVDASDDELAAAGNALRRAAEAHGALFVLDERADLVDRLRAHGVQLGPAASLSDARRAVGDGRLVGVTATTTAQLGDAPDYFAVEGGLELVRAARDAVRVPWFARGAAVEALAGSGAYGADVTETLRDAVDPETAARSLRAVLPRSDAVVVQGSDVLLPQVDWLYGTREPGRPGVAPHTHAAHTDVFYVLDGEMEFRLGDATVRVPPGSCAAAPPRLVHGFRGVRGEGARFLNLHAPGVWARGREHGLSPEEFDTFGVERATSTQRPIVSAPGEGDRLRKEHRLALAKVEQPELDLLEYFVEPGYTGASLHLHVLHADCFHVLEGELEFGLDGVTVRAEPGTSVVVPPGVPHQFTSAGRARFLNVHAPSRRFAEYLRRVDAGEEIDPTAYDVHDLS
jgi:thiamine-phosphate pyrophosphorylase